MHCLSGRNTKYFFSSLNFVNEVFGCALYGNSSVKCFYLFNRTHNESGQRDDVSEFSDGISMDEMTYVNVKLVVSTEEIARTI